MRPKLIALHGYAQSGKDTVAEFLAEYGYERFAFADRLRDCVYALNPLVEFHDDPAIRLQAVVNVHGWDYAKVNCPEIRRLLQVFGTEVGRELIRDSIWVDLVFEQMEQRLIENPEAKFVITDMRFPNEQAAIRASQFLPIQLWKVKRPGVGPVNAHVSDAGLADVGFEYIIENDGTLNDLQVEVKEILGEE